MTFREAIIAAARAVRGFLFSLFYESYFAQILLVLFLCALPFLIFAAQRYATVKKIRSLCEKRGFTFTPHRKYYFLGNFKDTECEFSIVTKHRAFAVKLIGTKSKKHYIRLTDEENLEVHKIGSTPLSPRLRQKNKPPYKIKWYPHPVWEFYTYAERELPTDSILLCTPHPSTVLYQKTRMGISEKVFDLIRLQDGMRFWDMVFYTPDGFLKLLDSIQEGYTLYRD